MAGSEVLWPPLIGRPRGATERQLNRSLQHQREAGLRQRMMSMERRPFFFDSVAAPAAPTMSGFSGASPGPWRDSGVALSINVPAERWVGILFTYYQTLVYNNCALGLFSGGFYYNDRFGVQPGWSEATDQPTVLGIGDAEGPGMVTHAAAPVPPIEAPAWWVTSDAGPNRIGAFIILRPTPGLRTYKFWFRKVGGDGPANTDPTTCAGEDSPSAAKAQGVAVVL